MITIDNLYSLIRKDDENKDALIECLFFQNWFNSIFEFDPITNRPLPTTNDELFSRINKVETKSSIFWWNDRIENIIHFTELSVYSLFNILHGKIVSEHIITHSDRVKETDSTSIRWLSKKPGRTVRQKIADSGRMMGVFHLASIDTIENRLFKAFLTRLDTILYEKEQLAIALKISIPDGTHDFMYKVHRWLISDDASYIGQWNNSTPNNTLLSDKNYRKIWNAWRELIEIDEYLIDDFNRLPELECIYYFWNKIAECNISNSYRLLQAPVFRDQLKLDINPYISHIAGWVFQNNTLETIYFELKKESRCISIVKDGYSSIEKIPKMAFVHEKKNIQPKVYKGDVCAFDFSNIKPYFSISGNTNGTLDCKLIYQTWKNKSDDTPIDVSCCYSKMISQKFSSKTITIHDFFKNNYKTDGTIKSSAAANIFAKAIRNQLQGKKYYYLLPDEIDDFSPMQISLRHQLNINFPDLSPLPRSIAKIFQIYAKDGREVLNKKYLIVDRYDSYWIVTKVIPKESSLLSEKYPDSDGIVFEHFPSTVIYKDSYDEDFLFTLKDSKLLNQNFSIDENNINSNVISDSLAEMDRKLSEFRKKNQDYDFISVTPNDNLTSGAIIYDFLQCKTPEVMLWKEHLPSLRLETGGQKLVLVDDRTEGISPKKGTEVDIKVVDENGQRRIFEMPLGKDFYEFSLFKGENKENTKYFAYLKHESFPLKKNIRCFLKLTYTYGDEQPYKLKFIPDLIKENPPFKYVLTKWENESHQEQRKLPYPDFCKEYTWNDMRHYAGRKSSRGDTSNFIDEWLPSEFEKIINFGTFYKINSIDNVSQSTNPKQKGLYTSVNLIDPVTGNYINTSIFSHRQLTNEDKIICSKVSIDAEKPFLQSEMKILTIKKIFRNTKRSEKDKSTFVTELFLDYEAGAYCYLISNTSSVSEGEKVVCCIQSTPKGYSAYNPTLVKEYGTGYHYKVSEIKENFFDEKHNKYNSSVFLEPNEISTNKAPYARIVSERELQIGDDIYCSSVEVRKGFRLLSETDNQFYRSLRMPVITVWNNARSIEDSSVPPKLKQLFYKAREVAFNLAIDPDADKKLKDEMLFFLCAVHKDSHPQIVNHLIPLILKDEYLPNYTRNLSYIIGDCTLDWQKDILKNIIIKLSQDSLRESCMKILASSLWRTRNCIYNLNLDQVNTIINALQEESRIILFALRKNNFDERNDSIMYTCCLETLFAILRLRESDDLTLLELLSPTFNERLSLCNENLINISDFHVLNVKERFTFSGNLTLQQAVEKYTIGNLGENEIRILSIEDDGE